MGESMSIEMKILILFNASFRYYMTCASYRRRKAVPVSLARRDIA